MSSFGASERACRVSRHVERGRESESVSGHARDIGIARGCIRLVFMTDGASALMPHAAIFLMPLSRARPGDVASMGAAHARDDGRARRWPLTRRPSLRGRHVERKSIACRAQRTARALKAARAGGVSLGAPAHEGAARLYEPRHWPRFSA